MQNSLAPVASADRLVVLDVLRGIAILGIVYMNLPFMGASVNAAAVDIRLIGWSVADRTTWAVLAVLLEGTQRGLLEFLFGAGMLVLARRAMSPDGPVAVADLYYRRSLWLVAFGLFDVFVLLWPGDILHIYGLAALALFPFRRVAPHWLLAIGLSFALFTAMVGVSDYASASLLQSRVEAIEARPSDRPLTPAQRDILSDWQQKRDAFTLDKADQQRIVEEHEARTAGASITAFVPWIWGAWIAYDAKGGLLVGIAEAFCAMLIGAALFKWGVIQGRHDTRFYLKLMLVAYGYGFGARALGVAETFSFAPGPQTIWFTDEFARLATTLGHVALANLLVRTATGARLLAPFKAAGRAAFSLYFMQQVIGIVLFAPFARGMWGNFGWAGLAAIATVIIAVQLVVVNLWMRWFVAGPLEWLWRSLTYLQRQPFRRV